MTYLILGAVVYVLGWFVFIFANEPRDSFEGALLLVTGILWPIFMLGWLISRRTR